MKGHFAAIALVLTGTFFLLSNLNLIHVSLFELFSVWWPVILIGMGVWLFLTPNAPKKD